MAIVSCFSFSEYNGIKHLYAWYVSDFRDFWLALSTSNYCSAGGCDRSQADTTLLTIAQSRQPPWWRLKRQYT